MAAISKAEDNAVRDFSTKFFRLNPAATVNRCLKALHNARLPTLANVVREVHHKYVTEKLANMTPAPSKDGGAGGPRLTEPEALEPSPEDEEPEPMADPRKEVKPAPLHDTRATSTAPAHESELQRLGRELVQVMRLNGIQTLNMEIEDSAAGASLEYDVVFRQRANGKITL